MIEEWRDVTGYEGRYQVSNLGRIKSLPRDIARTDGKPYRYTGRIRKQVPNPQGYFTISLSINAIQEIRVVHHLVAEAFLGPRPEGMYVCHNDGTRTNNAASNLRYDTPRNNILDMRIHGTNYHLNRTHCPQGHPYSEENTYRWRGRRACRTCSKAAVARCKARKRAAS